MNNALAEILSGVVVIELANVLAGPSASMALAEMGARVIKVEPPGGDVTRQWFASGEKTNEKFSSYFTTANWGKEFIELDFNEAPGLNALHRLLAAADVLIMSYKPGDAAKWGITPEALIAKYPELVIATVNGFGPTSPKVAYDLILQAETGHLSMNGSSPDCIVKLPVAYIDLFASHQLRTGILAAYIHKLKTGKGSILSVSLAEAAISALANRGNAALATGGAQEAMGSLHPSIAPYGESITSGDGQSLILAIGTNAQFKALCKILGLEELADDEAYIDNISRVKNRRSLIQKLQAAAANLPADRVLTEAEKRNVPIAAIKGVREALREYPNALIQEENATGIRQCVWNTEKKLRVPQHINADYEAISKEFGFDGLPEK